MGVLNSWEKSTDDYNKQKANVSANNLNWIWNIKQRIICRENIPEKRPDKISFSLKGIGFSFSFLTIEIIHPAIAHSKAPNHIMTEGYLNGAGGRLGSMDG